MEDVKKKKYKIKKSISSIILKIWIHVLTKLYFYLLNKKIDYL